MARDEPSHRDLHCLPSYESCSNSFYQDYGLVRLPPPSLFDRQPSLTCRWNFTVKEGDTVLITLHSLSVDEAPGCSRGYVEIIDDIHNSPKTLLSKTCSPIYSPARFKSDSNSASILFYAQDSNRPGDLLASVRTVSRNTVYKLHPVEKSWSDAKTFCEEDAGELASVYPVPDKTLADLVENSADVVEAWVGQFVTPWVWLNGCVTVSDTSDMELRYMKSKFNQKTECSVACFGSSGFLLQGSSCYCGALHHHYVYNQLGINECNIPCPGNMAERCGGTDAFTFYEFHGESSSRSSKYRDCLSETITSFKPRYCHNELGFTCSFSNGTTVTYYNNLSWHNAVSYCESLVGSVGLHDLPIWPRETVRSLWTSMSRGQNSNFPQIFNKSEWPIEAYIASVDDYNPYELKLRNTSQKYPFICEYRISDCGGNFTSTSGELQSPGFPDHYGFNQLCKWKIMVPAGNRVRIEFSKFQLEEHELCLYDFVKIVSKTAEDNVIPYCGNLIPGVFVSDSNNITVIFKSDNSITGSGFRATWKADYEDTKSEASSWHLQGATIAGIVLGVVMVVVCLFLIFFICYRKRHKKKSSSGQTISNPMYGVSSINDDSVTGTGHSYINSPVGRRQPDIVEQCYTNSVRADLDDFDEPEVYNYETIASNRLEIDALEFCQDSGSQANLIVPEEEGNVNIELHRVHKTRKKIDQESQIDEDDNITIESRLSLDNIENIGISAIREANNQDNEDSPFGDSSNYNGISSIKGEIHYNVPEQSKSQTMENETLTTTNPGYEILQNKSLRVYRKLDYSDSHTALTEAPSHTYEDINRQLKQ